MTRERLLELLVKVKACALATDFIAASPSLDSHAAIHQAILEEHPDWILWWAHAAKVPQEKLAACAHELALLITDEATIESATHPPPDAPGLRIQLAGVYAKQARLDGRHAQDVAICVLNHDPTKKSEVSAIVLKHCGPVEIETALGEAGESGEK